MNNDFLKSFWQPTSKCVNKFDIKIYISIFLTLILFVSYPVTMNGHVFAQSTNTSSSVLPDKTDTKVNPDSSGVNRDNDNEQMMSQDGLSNSTSSSISDGKGDSGKTDDTRSNKQKPDGDCLFDPSLPKCAPDENGDCPSGFYTNENGQCFPKHDECPEGYHGEDDDETGRCIPNSEGCPSNMIFTPDKKSCSYKEYVCKKYPNLKECKKDNGEQNEPGTNSDAYRSGYSHGCSDAKITDESKRYISQPGKGPNYHTNQFMNGYDNGFEGCTMISIDPIERQGATLPIAKAGSNITVTAGQTVTLDGSNSYDADGKIVKYQWKVVETFAPSCSNVSLINENSSTPRFSTSSTLSQKCTSYYELEVTDNDGLTASDGITITVKPFFN